MLIAQYLQLKLSMICI